MQVNAARLAAVSHWLRSSSAREEADFSGQRRDHGPEIGRIRWMSAQCRLTG